MPLIIISSSSSESDNSSVDGDEENDCVILNDGGNYCVIIEQHNEKCDRMDQRNERRDIDRYIEGEGDEEDGKNENELMDDQDFSAGGSDTAVLSLDNSGLSTETIECSASFQASSLIQDSSPKSIQIARSEEVAMVCQTMKNNEEGTLKEVAKCEENERTTYLQQNIESGEISLIPSQLMSSHAAVITNQKKIDLVGENEEKTPVLSESVLKENQSNIATEQKDILHREDGSPKSASFNSEDSSSSQRIDYLLTFNNEHMDKEVEAIGTSNVDDVETTSEQNTDDLRIGDTVDKLTATLNEESPAIYRLRQERDQPNQQSVHKTGGVETETKEPVFQTEISANFSDAPPIDQEDPKVDISAMTTQRSDRQTKVAKVLMDHPESPAKCGDTPTINREANEPGVSALTAARWSDRRKTQVNESSKRIPKKQMPVPCKKCKKVYRNKHILSRHMKYCGEPKIRCDKCKRVYTVRSFTDHKNRLMELRCKQCLKVFDHRCEYFLHKMMMHGLPNSTEQRTSTSLQLEEYSGKSRRTRTTGEARERNAPKSRKKVCTLCEKCGKVYKNRDSLFSHQIYCCQSKVRCDECGREFTPSTLKRHKRLADLPCTQCPGVFRSRCEFLLHVKKSKDPSREQEVSTRKHLRDCNETCGDECNQEFTHQRSFELNKSLDKTQRCTACDAVFDDPCELSLHQRKCPSFNFSENKDD